MRSAVAESAFTVELPESTWVVRVDPALCAVLGPAVDEQTLTAEVQRIMRLYLNTDDGDGPVADLADVRATPAQSGWEATARAAIAGGGVVEDPGYFDVDTLGPLPDEPGHDGPCRYLLMGTRVWLDVDMRPDSRPEMWLMAASPAAHTALDQALRPKHPRPYFYVPANRDESWPFSAVVDPDLRGFC